MPLIVPWTWVAPASTAAKRIGHGQFAIVVTVNTDVDVVVRQTFDRLACHLRDSLRQRSAIGIAQCKASRPGRRGGLQRLDRVFGIGVVAIEEMFRIINHFGVPTEKLDAIADHLQVFIQRDAQDFGGVVIPSLADQRDEGCLRGDQSLHAGIVFGLHRFATRHPERADLGITRDRVCGSLQRTPRPFRWTGVAAFDEIDPHLGQPHRNVQLVLQREADAFALRSVAQSRVVDLDRFQFHRMFTSCAWCRKRGQESFLRSRKWLLTPFSVLRIRKNPRTYGASGVKSVCHTESSHSEGSPAAIVPASDQANDADDADNNRI